MAAILGAADSLKAQTQGPELEAEAEVKAENATVPLFRLMLSILWVGAISMGGRSASFLLDELVLKRKWLRREDWLEGLALSRVLPGPSGPSTAVFMVLRLKDWRVAAVCLALYVVPGAVAALVLTLLICGVDRPAWVAGGVRGLAVAAVAYFVYAISQGTGAAGRAARLGWVFMGLSFGAYFVGADMLTILLVLGGLSLFMNRPRAVPGPGKGEGS